MLFTATYTLNKPYFYECFDESLAYSAQAKPKYLLLVLLSILGLVSFYILNRHYLGSFMIMMAVVECVAFYYRRPWWVTRQMLSRASGSDVELVINDVGITASNPYNNYQLNWQQVDEVIETHQGLLLKNKRSMQYISKQILTDEVIAFIKKAPQL